MFFLWTLSFFGVCAAKISVIGDAQDNNVLPPIIVLCDGPDSVSQEECVVVEPFEKKIQDVFKSIECVDDFMRDVADGVKPGDGFVASVKKIFELKKACELFMQNRPNGPSLAKSLSKKTEAVLCKAKELIVKEPASLVSCELKGDLADEDILKILFKDPEEKAIFLLKKIKSGLRTPFTPPQDSQEQGLSYSKALGDLHSFFVLNQSLIFVSNKLKKSFLKICKFAEQQGESFFGSSNLFEYKNPILQLTKSCLDSKVDEKHVFSDISERAVLANLEAKCLPVCASLPVKPAVEPSLEKVANVVLAKEKTPKKFSGDVARAAKNRARIFKKAKKSAHSKKPAQPGGSSVVDSSSSELLAVGSSDKLPKKRNCKKKQQVVDLDFPKIDVLVKEEAPSQKIEIKVDDLFEACQPISIPYNDPSMVEQDGFVVQIANELPPAADVVPPADVIQASCEMVQLGGIKDIESCNKASVANNEEETALDRAKASVLMSIKNQSKLKY